MSALEKWLSECRERVDRSPELFLSLVSLAGVVLLHGARAQFEMFRLDEIITAGLVGEDVLTVIADRYKQAHSPLYFLIIKAWVTLGEGLPIREELWIRIPSMVAMGLAGAFLGSAAWRAWSPLAGILFVGLWCTHALMYFSGDARPYGFLFFVLALGIWSTTRLWLGRQHRPRALWGLSALAPALAAALIPVGILATASMELAMVGRKSPSATDEFLRRWRIRTAVAVGLLAIVAAAYVPALMNKAPNYWTQEYYPFAFDTVRLLLTAIALQALPPRLEPNTATMLASFVLVALAAITALTNPRNVLVRLALGLAVVFPLLVVLISIHTSLLSPHYIVPIVPGVLLLAVGMVGLARGATGARIFAGLILVAFATLMVTQPTVRRVSPNQEIELLAKIQPASITGGVTDLQSLRPLKHYVSRRLGIEPNLRRIDKPIKVQDLPSDEPFWVFSSVISQKKARRLVKKAPVVCKFALPASSIYLLAVSEDAVHNAQKMCDAFGGTKQDVSR